MEEGQTVFKLLAKLLLFVLILIALLIGLNWDYIRESITNDDNILQRRLKENMFSKSPTRTDKRGSSDGRSDCTTAPKRPSDHHTIWYHIMITIDFLITHKKSIIISIAAVSLYYVMF